MKSTIVAVAGLLSVASAQSLCAVNCFQSVVTEHPPLSCKEANMYLCFCKAKDLQDYFGQCAYSKCGDTAEATVNFGVNLCKDMGIPIERPTPPKSSTSIAVATPSAPAVASSQTPVIKSSSEASIGSSSSSSTIKSPASTSATAATLTTSAATGVTGTPTKASSTSATTSPAVVTAGAGSTSASELGLMAGMVVAVAAAYLA